MAARAGTATVMEAVETADDADMLRSLGIDYGQGFFFLEPLAGAELARLLHSAPNAGDPPHIGGASPLAPSLP
jgi:EAL domain-containing protein (putative c-di-GMP-specific phosphodiesterase class I)